MDDTQLLFSTNTYLSLFIAKRFYNDLHYLWFSPFFHKESQPKTSDPLCRCRLMLETIATHDTHDEFLETIRTNMEVGVQNKLNGSVITMGQSLEIRKLIETSKEELYMSQWCMPIVIVTTWSKVKDLVLPLSNSNKASSTSVEILCNLVPRSSFDLINFEDFMQAYGPFRKGVI